MLPFAAAYTSTPNILLTTTNQPQITPPIELL
jgi:hypothetical protein